MAVVPVTLMDLKHLSASAMAGLTRLAEVPCHRRLCQGHRPGANRFFRPPRTAYPLALPLFPRKVYAVVRLKSSPSAASPDNPLGDADGFGAAAYHSATPRARTLDAQVK